MKKEQQRAFCKIEMVNRMRLINSHKDYALKKRGGCSACAYGMKCEYVEKIRGEVAKLGAA